jgi:uncharacterized protein
MENYAMKIVGICVLAFIIQLIFPIFEDTFLLTSSEVFSQPWTLVTSMFLHGDFMHLFYNMFALGLFGLILEKIIGGKKFLIVYFVGGIVASISVTFFYNAALGASGGVMAILGCLAVLRPKMRVFIGMIPMPMFVAALVWIGGDVIGLFAPSGIANAAHLGGMFFGLVAGLYLRNKYLQSPPQQTRQISESRFNNWEDRWM